METRPTLLVPCQPINSSLSRPNKCATDSYARLKKGRRILDLDLGFAEMGHWRLNSQSMTSRPRQRTVLTEAPAVDVATAEVVLEDYRSIE